MNRYEILLGKLPPFPESIDIADNLSKCSRLFDINAEIEYCLNRIYASLGVRKEYIVPLRLNNIVYGVARKNFKVYPLPESALPHYGDIL